MVRVRACVVGVLLWAVAVGTAFAADQKQMSVTVKETQVRATPSYLGKILGVLAYGVKVLVLDQPADAPRGWLKVTGPEPGLQGWVNSSALTQKELALKSGSEKEQQEASSGEVALAGKGFNADVERQYKEEQKLDYTWVDNMEGHNDKMKEFLISSQQLSVFLSAGGLSEQGVSQ